jgi:hypothetical protein
MAQSVTISASLRLRPTRIGFLVRPDDMAAVRQVMQLCTCLWGGIYNPIIPVCASLPEAWRERNITGSKLALGYIRFFEPDVFVETHDGLAAELGLRAGDLDFGEPRIIPISTFSDLNPDRRPRPFGTSVEHVYRRLYEREFRFVSRDAIASRRSARPASMVDSLGPLSVGFQRMEALRRCAQPTVMSSGQPRLPPTPQDLSGSSRKDFAYRCISHEKG